MNVKEGLHQFDSMIDWLLAVVSSNKYTDEIGSNEQYAKLCLERGRDGLTKINMYDQAKHMIDKAFEFAKQGMHEKADALVLDFALQFRERSGRNAELRKLYSKK
jgi:hypothetical protein